MFNRRYALIGWLLWNFAKQVGKRKAKRAVPTVDTKKKRLNKPAIVGAFAGLAITAWIVGKLKRGGGPSHVGE
jgi:hypothetical protein